MFVNCADTHLQVSAWSGRPELGGDSLKAFQQIVTHTIDNKATALVISGDLLDANRPSSAVMHFLMQQLDRLAEADIPLYFIQGQHCRADPPWLFLNKNHKVHHLKPDEAVRIPGERGVRLCGMDNMPAEQLKEALAKIPADTTHLVLHQMLKPLMGWNMELEWVPEHVKLVLLGDYHKPYTNGRAHYPGSICMQAIDELPDKYFFEVSGTTITQVSLLSRQVLTLAIMSEEDLQKAITVIKAAVPNEIGNPLVIVRCGWDAEKSYTELRASNPDAVIMLRAIPVVKEESSVSVDAPTLSGCVDAAIDSAKEPELRSFLLEVLSAPDARDVIELRVPKCDSTN